MKALFCFKEKLLAKSNNFMLCYSKGFLILKDKQYKNLKRIRILPWIKSFRLIERLFRKEPRTAVSLSEHSFLVSYNGGVYILDVDSFSLSCIHKYVQGMNNPLSFMTRKDKNGNILEVLYGEYIWNENKGPVSIYRYDLSNWECIYTFPKKTIKHIHNITYDEFEKKYLILTGDEDEESAIWQANEDFSFVTKIVGGRQIYRSCLCLSTKSGIYYTTDTPLSDNCLFFLKNDNALEKLFPVSGPCIFGAIKGDTMYFATSVEGDPTVGKFRYRFFNKLGKGVKDRFVHIMKYKKGGSLEEIAKFKKDILPMWLFQFGNATFVEHNGDVYFSTQSTKNKGTYRIIED